MRQINPSPKCDSCPHLHIMGERSTHWYACELVECYRADIALTSSGYSTNSDPLTDANRVERGSDE